MKNSELFNLACHCLVLDEYPELAVGIKEKILSGEADINRLVHLCSNQLVLPVIYRQFQNTGLIELFPKDFDEHLNEIYQLNTQRNKEILQQIDEISIQLNSENIEPVYLKGTANLLDNLYVNSGDRFIGDIDLLVTEKDYLKAADLIKKLGYKNDVKLYFDIKDQKHYPRLYRDDVPADIEIHHIPVNPEYAKKFNSNIIFSNKLKIENKTNCFVSSNNHKLIHTFIHCQLSNKGFLNRFIPLRDLYDFHLLSKRVHLQDFFNEVEEKNKAWSFYCSISFLVNSYQGQTEFENKKNLNYYYQQKWLFDHPNIHRMYIFTIKLIQIFTYKLPQLFLSKSMFKSFLKRISDIDYWKHHFLFGIKKYFS